MSYRYKFPILLLIALAAFWTVSISSPGLTLISGVVLFGAAVAAYFFIPWRSSPLRSELKLPPTPNSTHEALQRYEQLTDRQCQPQPAALNFDLSGDVQSLNHYFPIVKMLSASEINAFHQLVQHIAQHPNFNIKLIGKDRADITDKLPNSARHLVAGHIAEIFFFRQNMLARFLHTPRHFQLYTTPEAFKQDGGIAGGCYNPNRQCDGGAGYGAAGDYALGCESVAFGQGHGVQRTGMERDGQCGWRSDQPGICERCGRYEHSGDVHADLCGYG